MENLAGLPKEKCDAQITAELQAAGIPLFPFKIQQTGEINTDVFGMIGANSSAKNHGPVWTFTRAWYYWVARLELPSSFTLTMEKAKKLHAEHGKVVRVAGHCMCPDPVEWWGENGIPCLYHVDTQEGLNALAKAILE